MTMPTSTDLAAAIGLGFYDSSIAELQEVLQRRQRAVAADRAARTQIGDTFRLTGISPKGLIGIRVRALGFTAKSVEVELLDTAYLGGRRGTYMAGRVITVPVACVGEKTA